MTATGLSSEWAIEDEVIHVREWATSTVHRLGEDAGPSLTIGTSETCSIRVPDPSRLGAREHARLERSGGRWHVVDVGSPHGLLVDGARRERAELRPGVEISLGDKVTLIAESPRSIAVREALSRIIGLGARERVMVDLALRKVRAHSARRPLLVLCGGRSELDLVPIAYELHRLTSSERHPFVLCHERAASWAWGRNPSIQTIADSMTALANADGGTLCLLNGSRDQISRRALVAILVSLVQGERQARIVICARKIEDVEIRAPSLIVSPPRTRKKEIDRLINEYTLDAAKRLACAEPIRLSPAERAWIRAAAGESVSDLQETTLRLVAVRATTSISAAAALLGISQAALSKWLQHRAFSKLQGL
jgi:FHA domain-containing protein